MHLRNILLAVGVLALVAGVSLALLWLAQRPSLTAAPNSSVPETAARAPAESGPAVSRAILVAARPIPSGTLLRDEDVAWKDVAGADASPDEILRGQGSEKKVLGALTYRDFAAGEPLRLSGLLKSTDRGFLAALLAPGSRAISIPVEASQSASGLVIPGTRVDIILTQTFGDDIDPARKLAGETVLKDLRVIAVDQQLGTEVPAVGKTQTADTAMPKTITLEVTERQAEKLMVASRLGKIDIAVRALGSADAAGETAQIAPPIWAAEVSPALKNLRRAPLVSVGPAAAVPPAQSAQKSIEVIHGSKLEAR